MDAMALYQEARVRQDALSGYYNSNVRVDSADGPVMVRIPAGGAPTMDLTMWPEHAVLEAIRPYVTSAPQLLHVEADPPFQIHEFIAGTCLDEVCPAGTPLPAGVLRDIGTLFSQLLRVPAAKLPGVPADWPADGDTAGFVALLLRLVRTIRADGDEATGQLYRDLGVPEDPCALLEQRAGTLRSRPFRLLHADIHRRNVITHRHRTVFLDWELALWGDPVYDLADHLHKMSYLPAERDRTVAAWQRVAPAECRVGWEDALAFYLAFERMKSAVVDTVRWARLIAAAPTEAERRARAGELADKLRAARPTWPSGPRSDSSPAHIQRAVERWAGRRESQG
ncbi:aminoglycoside phosphotransferase family protein [Streptomyces sp. NRRL S-1448]|uniref:aminoglycoside phosphotransferase family protein n=1 Tax=Streptomyces sp. NRRL S-1448 TaxID=1463883 RepID=UPI0004BF0827|nr:aminoglycoside phosphotransferase family protein [Streptomyces sp. NRRL S-1448]